MNRVHEKNRTVVRWADNPIITNEMMPFSCRGVYNSSAVKYAGKYLMVLRAEGYNLRNTFWLAESSNGFDWSVGRQILFPVDDPEFVKYGFNQYDPRVTKIDDAFYITFCVDGISTRMGMLSTRNFEQFKWEGFITGAGFRNTVLFPEKVNGYYTALERPNATGEIWLTRSPDLKFWGMQELVLKPGNGNVGIWGSYKLGPCGTPIKTEQGWLIIFHAVQRICDYEYIYHSGVMLTELDNPAKVISVCDEPILSPEEPYELTGHAPNVVFASSQIVEDDGSVKLYYGASDRYQCVGETSINLLLKAALRR